MATALGTALAVTVALVLLLVLAMTSKRMGSTRANAALVSFGYAMLLLASITGAGVDLLRALGIVLLVAIVYPVVFFTRASSMNLSRTIRGVLALIMAAALMALIAHMLSLVGWVSIPAVIVALSVAAGAIAVLGSGNGIARTAKWTLWLTLVLAWLIVVGAVALGDVGTLVAPDLAVLALPEGTYAAMALGVVALAAVDPLLRQTAEDIRGSFPTGALILALALISGVLAAPLIMFSGSFTVPSVPFLIPFGFLPAEAIGVVLALASLALISVVPGYLAVAGKLLAEVVRGDQLPEQELAQEQPRVETPAAASSIVLAAVVAGSLGIALSAPSVLIVIASLLAAAAGGAALPGIRPGLHALASFLGAFVGVVPVAFAGAVSFFGWSWSTAIGIALAAVAGSIAAAVLHRMAAHAEAPSANGDREQPAGESSKR
jgi:hypothetical protein